MTELPEGRLYTAGEKEFNFSLAISATELMRGLKGVASLEPFDGMIFDFGCDFSPIMTPKGLKFSIDIAFLTAQGEITEIHRLDPEVGFNQGTVRNDIYYALEVPVGFFDTHGLSVGDTISPA